MNIIKWLALFCVLVMGGGILFAFTQGDFLVEGSQIAAMPWGIVSLLDLYTGFTLFSAWIVYRERSLLRSVIWVILMLTLGFFAGSLYVLLAAQSSGGDMRRFFMGNRLEER